MMSPLVELNPALILFLPSLVVLGVLYWWFPLRPRTLARLRFDTAALAVALAAFVLANHWRMGHADRGYGRLAADPRLITGPRDVFLLVLGLAFWWPSVGCAMGLRRSRFADLGARRATKAASPSP